MSPVLDPSCGEPFSAFSLQHQSALFLLALLVAGLYALRGKFRRGRINKILRWGMALSLLITEIALQGWYLYYGLWSAERSLPLHLCGISLFLAALMLMNRSYKLYEVVYFWGLGGASQALLTPDTAYAFPHLLFFIFFSSHSLIILACLWMTCVEGYRPELSSLWKAFLLTNLYALFVALLNLALGSNYLYICAKPPGITLLSYLGPWPWYLLVLEAVSLVLFFLLYLPFLLGDVFSFKERSL